jgi:hypothetical protein
LPLPLPPALPFPLAAEWAFGTTGALTLGMTVTVGTTAGAGTGARNALALDQAGGAADTRLALASRLRTIPKRLDLAAMPCRAHDT